MNFGESKIVQNDTPVPIIPEKKIDSKAQIEKKLPSKNVTQSKPKFEENWAFDKVDEQIEIDNETEEKEQVNKPEKKIEKIEKVEKKKIGKPKVKNENEDVKKTKKSDQEVVTKQEIAPVKKPVKKTKQFEEEPWNLNEEGPKLSAKAKEKPKLDEDAWGLGEKKKEKKPAVIDRGGVKIIENKGVGDSDDDNSWDC